MKKIINKIASVLVFLSFCVKVEAQLNSACFDYLNSVNTSSVGSDPVSIVKADFNADGLQDLATANYGSNSISVLTAIGNGAFNSVVNYSVGTNPYTIKSADFNLDGISDIVVVNQGSNNISVLLGLTGGAFMSPINYSVGVKPYNVAVNDFNNDGNQDLVTNNYTSRTLSVLLGSPTGTFSPATTFSAGINPQSISSADFNNDGKMDLALTNFDGLNILLGTGVGTFSYLPPLNNSGVMYEIVSDDLDQNGSLDLVISSSNGLLVFSGNGTGTFLLQNINGDHNTGRKIIVVDVNNDLVNDIVALNSYDFRVFLGDGQKNFSGSPNNYSSGYGCTSFTAADFNSDNKLDFAIANSGINKITCVFGLGNASFLTPINYNSGLLGDPSGLCTGDFNNDGKLDVAVGNDASNAVYTNLGNGNGLLSEATLCGGNLNSRGAVAAADFNGDGIKDFVTCGYSSTSYTVAILIGNGTGSASQINFFGQGMGADPNNLTCADFNGDGNIDVATSNSAVSGLSVFLGTGTGSLSLPTNYITGALRGITSSDFNNDGFVDLATAGGSKVGISFGNGTGAFGAITSYTVDPDPYSNVYCITTGDFNNDGNVDIAAANYGSGNVNILLGSSTGTFVSAASYSVGYGLTSIHAADFNNDGKIDLVATQVASYNIVPLVVMLYGQGTGIFNAPLVYKLDYSASNVSSGDFNSDGNLDLLLSGGNGTKIFINSSTTPLTITGSSLTCSGTSINLSVSGGNHYSWSTGAATQTIAVSPNSNSTYSVTGFNSMGCAISGTTQVLVNPSPTVSINNATVCLGQTYSITPAGADSYTFSSVVNVVTPTVTTTYTIIGSNFYNCTDTVTTQIIVNLNPSISIVSTSSVCQGSSISIIASGANTYTWNTGATTSSISVMPTTTGTYTVTGTDLNNCSNTQTVSVTVDFTCQDVWPGDANSDGTADNLDVLELGLHYTQTGPPRASTSNSWQSYFANNWIGTITNGKNLNHSDCNGDGTINDDDTLAIYNNYGLAHAFKPVQTTTVNPQLSIVPDQATVVKGSWGSASIYLGDATTNINNINGAAFTVDFDNTLIETNSIYIDYQNSFLDAGQNLKFRKLDFANGKLFTATTHTINNNVSGNGKIATLHYQIKSSLTTDQVLNLGISQANQSDAAGVIVPLTSGTTTLMAMGSSVGLQELNGNLVSISPNPTNGSLTINSKTELQKIEVVTITGQVLVSEIPTNVSHTLRLDNFANGIYFVNVYQDNRIVKREKIVLNK
jgi:hypothetical protein